MRFKSGDHIDWSMGAPYAGAIDWNNPRDILRRVREFRNTLLPARFQMNFPGGDGGGGGGFSGGGGGGGGVAAGSTGAAQAGASMAAAAGGGTGSSYNQAPWLFPTSDFLNLDIGPSSSTGAVALPAIGATATILKFKCPRGRYAKVNALGIDFVANGGAAFVQGLATPTLLFSITRDGVPVPGYEQFNYLPGAVSSPIGIAGFVIRENQVLLVTVKNISLVVTTQSLAARIVGFLYSKKMHSKLQGYA